MFAKLARRSFPLVAAVYVAAVLVAGEDKTEQQDEPGTNAPGVFSSDLAFPPTVTREQVEAWRKKYAFESLKPRLEYERTARPTATPALGDAATAQLDREDAQFGQAFWNVRADSLEMLHTTEVDQFIARSGFGFSRRPQPGAQYIESSPRDVVDVVRLPESSEISEAEKAYPALTQLPGDEHWGEKSAALNLLPSRGEANGFHSTSVQQFASPWDFGLVKSVDRVAGFRAHGMGGFLYAPVDKAQPMPETKPNQPVEDKRWHVTRLELVSLLKHPTPRVYVSDHLPSMEELSSATAKTRDLDPFEAEALKQLNQGEELRTSSTPNRIEMLGAVRASKQCMQCHDVPRGTLLGAFSYELRRDPPIKLTTTPPLVQ